MWPPRIHRGVKKPVRLVIRNYYARGCAGYTLKKHWFHQETPPLTMPTAQPTTIPPVAHRSGLGATKRFGVAMLIMATIALIFSTLIMYDKLQLMLDPNFEPACTINTIVSCTDVMSSQQASAFGFPNPFIGMIGFPVVMTTGVVVATGVKLPKWYWYCTIVGLGLGVVFVHWLAYQAIYKIVALCPYCMVVWSMMLPLFIMTLVHVRRETRRERGEVVAHSAFGMPFVVLIVWYLGFFALIADQFIF